MKPWTNAKWTRCAGIAKWRTTGSSKNYASWFLNGNVIKCTSILHLIGAPRCSTRNISVMRTFKDRLVYCRRLLVYNNTAFESLLDQVYAECKAEIDIISTAAPAMFHPAGTCFFAMVLYSLVIILIGGFYPLCICKHWSQSNSFFGCFCFHIHLAFDVGDYYQVNVNSVTKLFRHKFVTAEMPGFHGFKRV